jgi:hypothetical protein
MFSAGAALLCSALVQCLITPNVELPSEAVCWAILPAVVLLARRYGSSSGATTSKTLLGTVSGASGAVASTRAWLFALGVGAACWYRAEGRIIVFWVSPPTPLYSSGMESCMLTMGCPAGINPLSPSRWCRPSHHLYYDRLQVAAPYH